MKRVFNKQLAIIFISCSMLITPITASAATLSIDSETENKLNQLEYLNIATPIKNINNYTLNGAIKAFQTTEISESEENLENETVNYSIGGALDWFSKVQYIFPREGNATVIDVDTGKSFQLKRTFGTNHADVEPLTEKDAETIKSIWNGWSWERRAVVVNSNDTIIAGSMTAFPHAGVENAPAVKVVDNRSGGYGRGQNLDSVKGNNVDGHMDIHFLNSRTHGTNVMQKAHQDMVRKAVDYIDKNY